MSKKPDGTKKAAKSPKVSFYKAKSPKAEYRHIRKMLADVIRVRHMKKPRGMTRAMRRHMGNYTPVNTLASLIQHPDATYAKSVIWDLKLQKKFADKKATILAAEKANA